jgi:hypothetical protein
MNLGSAMLQLAWLMNANGVLLGSIGASTSEFLSRISCWYQPAT